MRNHVGTAIVIPDYGNWNWKRGLSRWSCPRLARSTRPVKDDVRQRTDIVSRTTHL